MLKKLFENLTQSKSIQKLKKTGIYLFYIVLCSHFIFILLSLASAVDETNILGQFINFLILNKFIHIVLFLHLSSFALISFSYNAWKKWNVFISITIFNAFYLLSEIIVINFFKKICLSCY